MSNQVYQSELNLPVGVQLGTPIGDKLLPLVLFPASSEIDLTHWAQENDTFIQNALLKYGGILFRGFGIDTKEKFDTFVSANCKELLDYNESSSPRSKLTNKVYTSTEHPQDQKILLHNELSYSSVWPKKIYFCSVIAAESGGETPIADVGRVYDRIDPRIREKFIEKGWMLVRNYGDGFGLPWKEVFHTEDMDEVEAYCRLRNIEWEWKEGGRLRTRQVRRVVHQHPITGENLWFNHATFWHESSLNPDVRAMMLEIFGRDGLPYNTYYGDGTPIEDEVIQHLQAAYDAETVMFSWEVGDLLVLDNMKVAHGRNPFTGQRLTLVAMGEPYSG